MIDGKQEKTVALNIPENIKGPFIDIVEYTKYSLNKIEELPIYINVEDRISNSNKLKKEIFKFIKISYKIQEGYSNMLKEDEIKHKGDEKDVVTEADIMIESCFREQIINFVPNYTIAGEEDAIDVHDKTKMILLDPIDGTKWFIKGVDKYGTVLGVYRNGYNIMSVVLNTKKGIIYFSDLNGFETYNIGEENGEIIIKKNEVDVIDETEKDSVYLHLNFKGDDKFKNEEIKEKLEQGFKKFNKENNSNYNVVFMQTASDTGVKVGRKEVGGFVHYGPAPHDIAGNLVYSIHNHDLNFTNHRGKKYNYFDHDDLINSYEQYNENKNTNGKSYLYKYPMVMTNDKKLHDFILNILQDYKDIFDKKAKITN